jgi:hypothetical protein
MIPAMTGSSSCPKIESGAINKHSSSSCNFRIVLVCDLLFKNTANRTIPIVSSENSMAAN